MNSHRFIHIAGCYKSGTSWLLNSISAHPEVLGWSEFDPIRAVYRELKYRPLLMRPVYRLVGKPLKQAEAPLFRLRKSSEVFEKMFVGRGWIPLIGNAYESIQKYPHRSDINAFLEELTALAEIVLPRDARPLLTADRFDFPLAFPNTTAKSLTGLMTDVSKLEETDQAVSIFYSYLQSQCAPETVVATKAADQVACIPLLAKHSPDSYKVVIVRDGRDVAVSASYYQKLMAQWGANWTPRKVSSVRSIKSWAYRVRLLSRYAKSYNLIVLRYEDLLAEYETFMTLLLKKLGLTANPDIVSQIASKASFEAATYGRKPGESANHIVRKGVVGDWKHHFTQSQADELWNAARTELSILGYTREGIIDESETFPAMLR
ncbi:MAG: sulfotransferase domain-containing protein [Pseudomonadota bacterium]